MSGDRGSTLPLILGFFLLALTLVAGSVAAGDAFVQQRGLQDVCDGAATAAAATAVEIERGADLEPAASLTFTDVAAAAAAYLSRETSRTDVDITAELSPDAQTLTLTCTETTQIAFGAMFGKAGGVHHTAMSSVRAPLSVP